MLWLNRLTNPLNTPPLAMPDSPPAEEERTHLVPLNDLIQGQCGLIRHLDLANNDDKRLRTLGICPGRRVWLVRRGDPMVLKVMGTRIGLAGELAQRVTVEVCTPSCGFAGDEPAVSLNRGPREAGP